MIFLVFSICKVVELNWFVLFCNIRFNLEMSGLKTAKLFKISYEKIDKYFPPDGVPGAGRC